MIGGILIWISGSCACASGDEFTDAVAFYNTYGSGKIVFSNGAFYYSSRGKAGNPDGIRYGVLGQNFVMEMNDGESYSIGIALDEDTNPGSCKRISYVKKDGYYYSLYQVLYDAVFNRMQKRYPDVDFYNLMYNRKIQCQVNFLLCLVIDGKDQGSVKELENGQIKASGKVCRRLEQILEAADWSEQTRKALRAYYGIQMNIYQPSTWYAAYYKSHKAASGIMEKQAFTYGVPQKLMKCSFRKEITIRLEPGDGTWKGQKQESVNILLKSRFLGWSLSAEGKKKYGDQQQVKNLSNQQGAVINLYALWSEERVFFPDCQQDDCEFLGWSTEKYDILPAESKEEDILKLKLYQPGDSCMPETDVTFYAVWRKKRYQVQFRQPEMDSGDSAAAIYHYSKADVQEIRKLIETCGFAGNWLNRALLRREGL